MNPFPKTEDGRDGLPKPTLAHMIALTSACAAVDPSDPLRVIFSHWILQCTAIELAEQFAAGGWARVQSCAIAAAGACAPGDIDALAKHVADALEGLAL